MCPVSAMRPMPRSTSWTRTREQTDFSAHWKNTPEVFRFSRCRVMVEIILYGRGTDAADLMLIENFR